MQLKLFEKAKVIDDIDNRDAAQISRLNLLPGFHPKCRCQIVSLGVNVAPKTPTIPSK